MAKYKRTQIGSITKRKDGKGNVFQISNRQIDDLLAVLTAAKAKNAKAVYLNLESKKSQLEQLNKSIQEGKLSGELSEKLLEKVNNIPDFVLFEVTHSEKQD